MGEDGAMGDERNASAEQGAAIIGRMVEFLSDMIADMKKEKLPERMDPAL
jgi:creatinine amidohydrolase/Fe(II)-dependent formamide hydrolase-like protein